MEFEKEMPENKPFELLNIDESNHKEIFIIEPSGEIYINGELVGKDTDVVKALRQVLEPEINKNNIYNEMLEMLKKTTEMQRQHLISGCNTRFINIYELEELIQKATK